MLRLFQVKDIAERKKLLVLQSDIHRQSMLLQIATAQASATRLRKWFTIAGVSTAAIGVGTTLARGFFSKSGSEKKGGLISKVMSGVSYFNQFRSFVKTFRGGESGGNHDGNHD